MINFFFLIQNYNMQIWIIVFENKNFVLIIKKKSLNTIFINVELFTVPKMFHLEFECSL